MLTPTARRIACLALMMSVLIGCAAATRSTRFSQFPPRSLDHEIRIYRTTLPDRPFVEVGTVSARQRNKLIPMGSVLESLKVEARKMGGDAIIGFSEVNEAQGFVGNTGQLDRDPVLSGTVVRFTATR